MLTQEDKAVISDYMGWIKINSDNVYGREMEDSEDQICIIRYNLNDAGLCVVKMMEKGDWDVFYQNRMGQYALIDGRSGIKQQDYVAWLFNSQNFFAAMAAWLRGK